MQLSAIRTRIREQLAQTDSTNTQYSDALINSWINLGYMDFAYQTRAFEKEEDITTVANQVEYVQGTDWTTNFFKITNVRYVVDATNEIGRVMSPFPGGYKALPKNKTFGEPDWYVVRFPNTSLTELIPWPVTSASSEVLQLSGYYYPTELSLDADVPIMDTAQQYALVSYAVWKLLTIYAHKSSLAMQKALREERNYRLMVAQAVDSFSESQEEFMQVQDVYNDQGLF